MLRVIVQFKPELSVGSRRVELYFVVADNGRCLLGHATSKALGILHIGLTNSLGTECNNVNSNIASDLRAKYPRMFSGIGKLADYKLKLHVHQSVKPVAQKPRRILFAMRNKVTAKVNDVIEKELTERVQGPTPLNQPSGCCRNIIRGYKIVSRHALL